MRFVILNVHAYVYLDRIVRNSFLRHGLLFILMQAALGSTTNFSSLQPSFQRKTNQR